MLFGLIVTIDLFYLPELSNRELGSLSGLCHLSGYEETWQEHYDLQRENWENRFDDIQAISWKLRRLGIYYRDANLRKIQFG